MQVPNFRKNLLSISSGQRDFNLEDRRVVLFCKVSTRVLTQRNVMRLNSYKNVRYNIKMSRRQTLEFGIPLLFGCSLLYVFTSVAFFGNPTEDRLCCVDKWILLLRPACSAIMSEKLPHGQGDSLTRHTSHCISWSCNCF